MEHGETRQGVIYTLAICHHPPSSIKQQFEHQAPQLRNTCKAAGFSDYFGQLYKIHLHSFSSKPLHDRCETLLSGPKSNPFKPSTLAATRLYNFVAVTVMVALQHGIICRNRLFKITFITRYANPVKSFTSGDSQQLTSLLYGFVAVTATVAFQYG